MAVILRLTRRGTKKRPFYHLVAADSRFFRDRRFLEDLGTYDPRTKKVNFRAEDVTKWLSQGAQVTDAVRGLIKVSRAAQTAA